MQVEIIQDAKRIAELEHPWRELYAKSEETNIFLSFSWMSTWLKHFGNNYSVYITAVFDDNALIGIAPFVKHRFFGIFDGIRLLSFGLADYENILCSGTTPNRRQTIDAIFQSMQKLQPWQILRIEKIKESSPNYAAFKETAHAKPGIVFKEHKHATPFCSLKDTWKVYLKTLRKKFVADTQRQMERLKKIGVSCALRVVDDPKDINRVVAELAKFHIQRRKAMGQESFFKNPRYEEFFKDVAEVLLKEGKLHLSYLYQADKFVAFHLGFQENKTFFYYLPTFNQEFAAYSAGRVLAFELLRNSFERGFKIFDFMLGDEGYKDQFNPSLEKLYYWHMYGNSFGGELCKTLYNGVYIPSKQMFGKSW